MCVRFKKKYDLPPPPPHKQDYLKCLHLLVYSRNQAAHALELNGVFKSFLALLKQMFKMFNNSFN